MSCCSSASATTTSPTRARSCRPPAVPVKIARSTPSSPASSVAVRRGRDLADAGEHRDHLVAVEMADPELAAGAQQRRLVGHAAEQRGELLMHGADDGDAAHRRRLPLVTGRRAAGARFAPSRPPAESHRIARHPHMNRSPFRSHRSLLGFGLVALVACGGGGDDPVANLPPTVTLAAAATGTSGVAMTLTATAADSDDTVAKVEFFDGTTLLGEDTASPYSLGWTPTTHRRAQPHRPCHGFARRRDHQHRRERDGESSCGRRHHRADGGADRAGRPLCRPDRHARRLRHGQRQRRRDRRRVPDRRRDHRRGRHLRAVCRHRRHQPLHQRPARAAGAGERRRGQRLGLVDGAGAVRRQRVAAERLHPQRGLDHRPHGARPRSRRRPTAGSSSPSRAARSA